MDIEKINNLRNRIFEELKNYDIEDVIYFDAMRYSGITRCGLMIKRTTDQVMPCYLFEDDVEEYEDEAIEYFSKALTTKPSFVITVQSKEYYKDKLSSMPYKEMLDMVVVVKYIMDDLSEVTNWDIAPSRFKDVTYDMMKSFGINEEALFKQAYENTRAVFDEYYGKLSDIATAFNEEYPAEYIDERIYFLTNKQIMFGANILLYDEVLKKIHKNLEQNFYIIPCNIHQLLILPEDTQFNLEMIVSSIKWINNDILPDDEFLSDSLYYYNFKKKKLEIANV